MILCLGEFLLHNVKKEKFHTAASQGESQFQIILVSLLKSFHLVISFSSQFMMQSLWL